MTIRSFVNNMATKCYKRFSAEPGDLLLLTGTFGWILSSLGQISSIVFNDKISTKQKSFLIPQEGADAVVNIASFFVLTRTFTRFGEGLVKSGKLATNKIRDDLAALAKNHPEIKDKIGQRGFDIRKLPEMDELQPDKFDGKIHKHFFDLYDGVSFVSSTIGSIISSNIITPILRNKYASYRQKDAMAQTKKQEQQNNLQAPLTPNAPVLPAQSRINMDAYKAKTIGAYTSTMKI